MNFKKMIAVFSITGILLTGCGDTELSERTMPETSVSETTVISKIEKADILSPSEVTAPDEETLPTASESTAAVQKAETIPKASVSEVPETKPVTNQSVYILNQNSKKFHFSFCDSAERISPENRLEYTGTREEVIAKGYEPCKKCNP